MILTSAPGKIILLGEHAVVYDKLGIASALGRRCYIKISNSQREGIFIESKNLNLRKSLDKRGLFGLFEKVNNLKNKRNFFELEKIYQKNRLVPIFLVVGSLAKKCGFKNLKIEIDCQIPKNLGSSSAVFSATALGVSKFFGKELLKEEISALAFEGDVIAHGGIPSGIDNNVVTYGGYLCFKKSEGLKFLNISWKLPLIIVDSGEITQTSKTVALVKKLREKKPKFVNLILEELDKISNEGVEALKINDLKGLGNLMLKYYCQLKKLGISTEKLERIVSFAIENGALGAKPTGGWGGGCCLVLVRGEKEAAILMEKFKRIGFDCFQSELGVEGVKYESNCQSQY
jgi:mevalonate kinase